VSGWKESDYGYICLEGADGHEVAAIRSFKAGMYLVWTENDPLRPFDTLDEAKAYAERFVKNGE
jgi:hypothetical protein